MKSYLIYSKLAGRPELYAYAILHRKQENQLQVSWTLNGKNVLLNYHVADAGDCAIPGVSGELREGEITSLHLAVSTQLSGSFLGLCLSCHSFPHGSSRLDFLCLHSLIRIHDYTLSRLYMWCFINKNEFYWVIVWFLLSVPNLYEKRISIIRTEKICKK